MQIFRAEFSLGLMQRAPLWQCPKCERKFANRNQSHACGRDDLAHHFSGKPPEIRTLFDRVLAAIRKIGPVRVLPEKTRIAFQVRMSFAQVTPKSQWLDGHWFWHVDLSTRVFAVFRPFLCATMFIAFASLLRAISMQSSRLG